ncbi:MAG: O-antigen ligase family protein, partial [Bacteroidota bacterium]
VLAGFIHAPTDDVRDVFIFKISHIRFALFTCLAIVICLESMNDTDRTGKIISSVTALWLTIFLFLIESMTGISILLVLSSVYLLLRLRNLGLAVRIAVLTGILALGGWFVYEIREAYAEASQTEQEALDFTAKTAEGRPYSFNSTLNDYENGHRVWAYVCDSELEREWNRRSRISYHSDNELNQPIRTCLIRFMASKNLRKDAAGVNKLSFEEIQAVEKGVANVNYLGKSGMERRIKETAWELVQFNRGHDVNDHSLAQRLEYWKTSWSIIQDHPWIGVGTGDARHAFDDKYEEIRSTLRPDNRLQSHNQFLALGVALGIPIAIFFVATMFYLIICSGQPKDVYLVCVWLILLLSMMTEDTLETQPGATFFALAMSLFLFGRSIPSRKDIAPAS